MLPKGCSFHLIQNSSCVWCIKLDLLSVYNLVSNFTNRVAKSLAPWGANMQPMSHYKGARLPYLIWLVCCDSLDIRFKPLCQTLALVSAKDTDVSQPGKKCGLDFWLLSVKQTVTLCSLQRFFFFSQSRQPYFSISVPVRSHTARLLNPTLGPLRVGPHQPLSVFTSHRVILVSQLVSRCPFSSSLSNSSAASARLPLSCFAPHSSSPSLCFAPRCLHYWILTPPSLNPSSFSCFFFFCCPCSLFCVPRALRAQLARFPSGVVKYKYNKDVFVLVNPFWAEKHHHRGHRCGTRSGQREGWRKAEGGREKPSFDMEQQKHRGCIIFGVAQLLDLLLVVVIIFWA